MEADSSRNLRLKGPQHDQSATKLLDNQRGTSDAKLQEMKQQILDTVVDQNATFPHYLNRRVVASEWHEGWHNQDCAR